MAQPFQNLIKRGSLLGIHIPHIPKSQLARVLNPRSPPSFSFFHHIILSPQLHNSSPSLLFPRSIMPTLQELLQLQADAIINAGMSKAELEKARKDAEEALMWKDNLAEALTLAALLVAVIFALPSPPAETHQPNVQWRHRLIISAPVFLWRCTTVTSAIIAGTLFICLVVNFRWLPQRLRSWVKAAHVRMIQRICFLLLLFATITCLILAHQNEYIIYVYALCIVLFVFAAALIPRMLIRRCLANEG